MGSKIVVSGMLGVTLLAFAVILIQCGKGGEVSMVDKVKRGEYLVNTSGCHDCHTPKVFTEMGMELDHSRLLSGHPADEQLPEAPSDIVGPGKWGAVGNAHFSAWYGPWGTSYAANLTPDQVTGIGAWNEESFIMAMRTGKHLGAGRPILPPMPWPNLAQATDEDLSAIFAYLKSIKPIENMVPPPTPPGTPAANN